MNNNIYNRYIWLLHTVYQERKVTFERLCDIWNTISYTMESR